MPPPIGERVAALEVEVKNLTTGVGQLADTVTVGMEQIRADIKKQSMNGRMEDAKALVDDVGDPESRASLRSMIRTHDRRAWLSRPLTRWGGAGLLVILGGAVGHFWPN